MHLQEKKKASAVNHSSSAAVRSLLRLKEEKHIPRAHRFFFFLIIQVRALQF